MRGGSRSLRNPVNNRLFCPWTADPLHCLLGIIIPGIELEYLPQLVAGFFLQLLVNGVIPLFP
jgi:hypothetical protein